MKCQYCNSQVPPEVSNCPSCGAPVEYQPPQAKIAPPTATYAQPAQNQSQQAQRPPVFVERKSPMLAAFLSCLFVGLGQIYNGQVGKAIILFVVSVIVSAITGGIAAPFFWIGAIIDAYSVADRHNRNAGII